MTLISVCFAVACLDIGSGVVECLCKRGYIGACVTVRGDHVRLKSSTAFSPPGDSNGEHQPSTQEVSRLYCHFFLRCAFGYYGNPVKDGGSCKPCSCNHSNLSTCDPLTGGN